MVTLKNIEFHQMPDGEIEVREIGKIPYILDYSNLQFIDEMYSMIQNEYPEAYKNLHARYEKSISNVPFYRFKIVRGFLKCNMGEFDNKLDIDESGNFHFEFRNCPLLGECPDENIVCRPQRRTSLSPTELIVVEHIANGDSYTDISSSMYISHNTLKNHLNHIFSKLGTNNKVLIAEFFKKIKG